VARDEGKKLGETSRSPVMPVPGRAVRGGRHPGMLFSLISASDVGLAGPVNRAFLHAVP